MPIHASEVYAKNISALLALMINKDKQLEINFADDILDGSCVTHNGEIRSQRVKDALSANSQQVSISG
jgi:NAD(P) transhydrogenase subunit alpha